MKRLDLFSVPVDETGESTRLVRRAMFIIVFLFGGVVAWGAAAPISGAVVADGIIKVDTNRKSVQHYEGGIIKEILVREGEDVEVGQPLVVLQDTDNSAELNILRDTLQGLRAKQARLMAEVSVADQVLFPQELLDGESNKTQTIVRSELALFSARRKLLTDQIKLTKDEIVHVEEAVGNLKHQIEQAKSGLAIVSEQLAAVEKLAKKRAIDRNSVLELKRKLSDQNEAIYEQKAELSIQRQSIASLKLRIVNLRNEYSKSAEDELKETGQRIYETKERIRPVLDSLQRRTIRAIIDGQIINLQATTVGGVVKPGEVIAEIVPKIRDLVFEVQIRPQDADSVYVGQRAKVQLSAFNQRSIPMIDGNLTYVSGDALTQEGANGPSAFFLAHVKSEPEALTLIGDRTLTPGMPVVAFVQTEPRTFFEYVFSPVTAGMRRALTEDVR